MFSKIESETLNSSLFQAYTAPPWPEAVLLTKVQLSINETPSTSLKLTAPPTSAILLIKVEPVILADEPSSITRIAAPWVLEVPGLPTPKPLLLLKVELSTTTLEFETNKQPPNVALFPSNLEFLTIKVYETSGLIYPKEVIAPP